ncbi:MAG TPA: M20 family metallopeptidase [Acidimicrobiales bacterium]|nr:M20 family metallopeptidase [Acidimicrobiales bacterium]
MDVEDLRSEMVARVDALAPTLIEISRDIHAHPELRYEEHHAHSVLTAALGDAGVDVTPGAFGLDTAFDAVVGAEGPTIAVCLEYDALPGVGHACGHNVIAAAGLGAGLAAAALASDAGGRVRILGTPAEEGGAGKAYMIDRGALDGVDAAMMVHPADADLLSMDAIAAVTMEVEWFGEGAHAAAYPHLGRNALDAAVLAYVNIGALRQHIEATDRVHGIFTDGGRKPNIVPSHAAMEWMVRSAGADGLAPLQERVVACFEAGATATGCRCEHRVAYRPYDEMVDNPALGALFAANAASVGRHLTDPRTSGTRVVGSTDMGNVSKVVPSIHPMLQVAPRGVSIHTDDFARFAGGPEGDRAVVDGAKAMAMTIADLWARPGALDGVRAGFTPLGAADGDDRRR